MMNKLVVKEIVGPYCGTYEDGAKLFRKIYPLLKDAQQVELDFDGVLLTTSSFFNGAVINVLQEFSGDDGRLPVSFLNLTPRDNFVWRHTLAAASVVDETIVI